MTIKNTIFALTTLIVPLIWITSLPPIHQNPNYHHFADQSFIFGIKHFFDVATNSLFLLVGLLGLKEHRRKNFAPSKLLFIVGALLVAPGSAYYHLLPTNERLLWDRLPMVIGFSSLTCWLLVGYFNAQKEKILLILLNLIGLSSLAVWVSTDDLRFYYWVQLTPVLILVYLGVFKKELFNKGWPILAACTCYIAAKLTENYDLVFFNKLGISGHSLKHILAAMAIYALVKLEFKDINDRKFL